MSRQVRKESQPPVPLTILVKEADRYKGKTVILGGEILETENSKEITTITVLHIPLAFRHEPKAKDRSEGRFLVSHQGFLDPEVYAKGRRITVAGQVVGTVVKKVDHSPITCLHIQSREIYLWPEYSRAVYPWYAYEYDWYYYPYPYFYFFPFRWHMGVHLHHRWRR
jgi:outer membrane lipoprotein